MMNTKQLHLNGAEIAVACLKEADVDLIFGYPGGAIMPFYDALYTQAESLKHVLVRHEQGAIHAAQGYARATGKTGVCVATSGPGATNLITGLADAMVDSTPLVCITGQVPSPLLGTDAFQETDVISLSTPVTKWNVQVTSARELPAAMAKAFFYAQQGRPGPVLIDITKDAQFEQASFSGLPEPELIVRPTVPSPQTQDIIAAAALLNQAQRPFMLVGQGVLLSGAEQEVAKLAEKAGIPVAATLLGLSAMDPDHPQYVGMLGMHGNYAPNVQTNQCDVLLAVGMRFDDRVTGDVKQYARQAKVIHIDLDASELNKLVQTTVAIHADAKAALQSLIGHCEARTHANWRAQFDRLQAEEQSKCVTPEREPKTDALRMAEVMHLLSRLSDGQALVVTDVGQHQMEAARNYDFKRSNSHITSGGLGTMGFALPAALGAQLGKPDRQVVAVIGDGGFQMTVQELGTIFQTQAPLKVVIMNNNFLGMVRQWQELFFEERYAFTEMTNPDFVRLAQSYQIEAAFVADRANLESALRTMLDTPGPYLLEVKVEAKTNVFPMIPSGAAVDQVRLS